MPQAAPVGKTVKPSARAPIGGTTNARFQPTTDRTEINERVIRKLAKRGDTAALLRLLGKDEVRASAELRKSVVLWLASQTPGNTGPAGPLNLARVPGDPSVIPALSEVVARDPDPRIRRSAVMGLARMSDSAAIPALLIGLDSDDSATRIWAIRGLGKLKARDAVPGLVLLLDDRRRRCDAAEALVTIRDERALGPLHEAARHGAPWTRRRLRRRANALASSLGY